VQEDFLHVGLLMHRRIASAQILRHLMKEQNNDCSQSTARKSGERGVSIVEMLIVVVMISIVSAFALLRISGAQRAMRLTNSAHEFMAWLEKARLDSLRRHPMSNAEMASVTINSATSYSITIDQNGDGALDPARIFTIPGTHGAAFAGITIPTTIYYNWRGRPVDNSGNLLNLAFNLQDSSGNINPITLSDAGDATLGNSANIGNVSINTEVSSNANIKMRVVQ
jgi:prepilin-type N-terminal cleavage/methylation domain-containing protein